MYTSIKTYNVDANLDAPDNVTSGNKPSLMPILVSNHTVINKFH